jgi:non-ribosomal peptide synthetase component E (peptide arylation enzyme)
MIKKPIIALIVILAIVGLAFATNNTNAKNTTNTTQITNTINSTANTTHLASPVKQITFIATKNASQNNSTQIKISSAEAQNIAANYIQVSGAITGTPKLVYQSNKLVYVVPVMVNGTNVGEIDIDAQTGHNLGGAGGAP